MLRQTEEKKDKEIAILIDIQRQLEWEKTASDTCIIKIVKHSLLMIYYIVMKPLWKLLPSE